MDLLDSLRALRKRLWLTLPLLVLTLGIVAAGYVALPWKYQAKADVLFLASHDMSKVAGYNPFESFDGSLPVTAEVVGRTMMDGAVVAALKAQGYVSSYTVGVPVNTTGPVLEVDVTGTSPANAIATLNAVLAQIPVTFDQLQTGVQSNARIQTTVLTKTPAAARQLMAKAKPLVALLIVGLILTVGIPVLVEARAQRRRAPADRTLPRPTSPTAPNGAPQHEITPSAYLAADPREVGVYKP